MALRTSLLIAGDASGAVAALQAANDALSQGEKEAQALAEAYSRADAATGRLAAAQTAAKTAADQTKAAFAAGEIELEQYNRELLEQKTALGIVADAQQRAVREIKNIAAAGQTVHGSLGQQRAGFQQLGFQIGDFTTQVSSGTSISQAFAQQIGQTTQALQLMGGGSGALGKVAGFLGGPWGIAVTVALTALAPFVSKLFEGEEAAKKSSDAFETLAQKLDLSRHSFEQVLEAARAYNAEQAKSREITLDAARAVAAKAAEDIHAAIAIRQKLAAELAYQSQILAGAQKQALDPTRAGEGGFNPGAVRAGIAAAEVTALNDRLRENAAQLNDLAGTARNAVSGVAGELAKITSDPRYAIEQRFKRARNEAQATIRNVDDLAKAYARINAQEQAALKTQEERSRERTRTGGSGLAPVTGSEVARILGTRINSGFRTPAQNRAAGGAENSYHLTGQAIDIPLTVNGHPLTKAGIRSALEEAGVQIKELLGPGDKDHNDHFHIAFAKKRAAPDEILRSQTKAREDDQRAYDASIKAGQRYVDQLRQEGEEIGLTAAQLRALRHAREVATLPTEQLKRQANEAFALKEVRLSAEGAAAAIGGALASAFTTLGDRARDFVDQGIADELERQASAARALYEQVRGTAQIISTLGGTGRAIGGVISGLSSGDLGSIPGQFGALAGLLGNVKVGERDNGEIIRLGDRISAIFKSGGPFAQTMASVLEGTGLGLAAGGAILGGKNSGLGSAIGGGIGEVIGKKVLSKGLESIAKGLGDFAGPLGAIAGGVLGGLVGGLFKKTKTGSATVGSVDGAGTVTGTGGNSQSRISAARGLAGSGLDALDQIIAQLGGDLGSFSASIGVRNKKFVVDPTGAGRTKGAGTQKFASEEEATKALLADIIADGAVKGVSAAVEKALRSNSDVEKGLKEALKVQQVELAIGGIGAELRKAFSDFERQAAERLRIGREYGFDLVKIEERNAQDRLKLSQELLDSQVGSLQRLVDELTGGSLFEGSAVDKRKAILSQIDQAKADANAGVEGAADKLAKLLEDLNAVSKEVYGTTGGFASDRAGILDQARDAIAQANLRIADAQKASDPALATTNAALDENNDQNARIIAELQSSNALIASWLQRGAQFDLAGLAQLAATS